MPRVRAPVEPVVRRAVFAELERVRRDRPGSSPRVLDVGGGSGAWAVPLAAAGCVVTVVDASPNALAALHRRARQAGVAGGLHAVQGDVQALGDVADPGAADLVLGHGLLEVVDDVAAAVRALAAAAAPGGAVSILVAGRHAAVLARVQAGRLAQAAAVLADPAGRWGPADPLHQRLDVAGLRALLTVAAGLRVELLQGDGVFEAFFSRTGPSRAGVIGAGHGPGPGQGDELTELEAAAAADPALLAMAARLHALARRPGPG